MLRAVHGDRVEGLFGALLANLPPADPFAPVTVVTGSRLVGRWLSQQLAFARGIAAGLDLVTFDRFVERTWGHAELLALDRDQLAAAIATVLAEPRFVATLPPVATYLGERGFTDRAGPRRVQLAEQVAGLVWSYALWRPAWLPALLAGRVPDELAGDETARWQAALLGEALARFDRPAAPIPALPWLRRRAGLLPPAVASPIAVFGASYLARAQLEALSALAETADVTVYMLDPCEELWDDVPGRASATGEDPLLLALWGRAVRGTVAALVERSGGDIESAFVSSDAETALHRMLADVRARQLPSPAPAPAPAGDAGVTVVACTGERREMEAVAARLRAHLDADPALRAHELAVWIAGDAERYLAQATSVFEAVGLPCHLIDAPIDDRGRIGEAVLALLELPTSQMTRADLMRVMTHPAVLAAHPHVDVADWLRWTEALGIAHGADAHAHARTYLGEQSDKFHWDQGVRRLALGAYMTPGAPARIGRLDVVPEPVQPDELASAATYALLVRSLTEDAKWLADHAAALTEWASLFVGLVDAYIDRGGGTGGPFGETSRDVERARQKLAGLARVDLDGRRVGFREAREHAVRALADAQADRGEPLAAGVMVAPLRAHRAVPFRIACVVGLAEGAFPAGDTPSPLDVRRTPLPGDVSPRDADRQAFFEVLLGARDRVYLSYVAAEPKSGQLLGPSSVVLELADALAPYLGADSSRAALEQLTAREPLHRWTGASELPTAERARPAGRGDRAVARELPSVARERWAARVQAAIAAHLRAAGHAIPDADGMFALLAHPPLGELRAALGIVGAISAPAAAAAERQLSLANVRAFLESPVQAWAQAVLDLDELPDDEQVAEHSDEPFHIDRGARTQLLRAIFAEHLVAPGSALDARYDATVSEHALRGQFPVGVFGDAERAVDVRTLEIWAEQLAELGPVGGATRIAFGRAPAGSVEPVPALELAIAPDQIVRLVGTTELLVQSEGRMRSVIPILGDAELSSRHHLRGAIDHLVLAATGRAPNGHEHVLLAGSGKSRVVIHAPWPEADARAFLAALVRELVDESHGYLLPFEVLAAALQGSVKLPGRRPGSRRPETGYGPIERADGLALPPDAIAIAERRFRPFVARMGGDHGFGDKKRGAKKAPADEETR